MQKIAEELLLRRTSSYASGFQPSPDPCAAIQAPNQTTT